MRLWSINPCFLDNKGLVAVWREALLAQKVLTGSTKGYTKHRQLIRFQQTENPLASIGTYLHFIHQESIAREYSFNKELILFPPEPKACVQLHVSEGQLVYETQHFLKKTAKRDPERWSKLQAETMLHPHPMFQSVPGELEKWEITIPLKEPSKTKKATGKRKAGTISDEEHE